MTKGIRSLLAGILLVGALMGCGGCSTAGTAGTAGSSQVETRTLPLYVFVDDIAMATDGEQAYTMSASVEDPEPYGDIDVYFIDGHGDIPYIAASVWRTLIGGMFPVECTSDGPVTSFTREDTNYTAVFDADKDSVTFLDYNAFFRRPDSNVLVEGTSDTTLPEETEGSVLSTTEASYNRFGSEIVFDFGKYDIDLVEHDGECLIPIQSLSDIGFGSIPVFLYYDGESIVYGTLGSGGTIGESTEEPTTLSEEFATYNYNEFCFLMDHFYGLKDTHGIESFDAFFDDIGFKEALSSTDPREVEDALYDLLLLHLDDIHSTYLSSSPYAGMTYVPELCEEEVYGYSRISNDVDEQRYKEARAGFYPDGYPIYEEVGDTAFITFDSFEINADDYYNEELPDPTEDTISLIIKAHEQVTRKDSPIKNVVIDLSCNTGGAADTAAFVMSWFLGEAPIAMHDTLTGGMSLGIYRADVNLDHSFDEKDEIGDRNLYCLISPVSFSCGNLVPSVFKQSGRVTLLGRQSCGGSCEVRNSTNALGSNFTISGNTQCSFTKNGSFYNIDEGVLPDYTLNTPESYYDRTKLVEYIHELV